MLNKKTFILFLIGSIFVNAMGLLNPIFMVDSALYASISKSFVTSNNYLDIIVQGQDWLDKPHFPFWVCAFFIKIFGATAFAYKLPSLLFFGIGMIYTYKLSKRLYSVETAYLSVLLLSSALHIIISNNDVRAEAILLGVIMGGIYHLYLLTLKFKFRDVILASLWCAAAIMTKGIFVLIIFYSAIFGHLFFKKEWKLLFHYRWLLVLLLTFIFTIPELYAVYTQFDLHPEKTVFGRQNVSGVQFFLWDSQFGRFFNNGPIKGKGDLSYFFHTMLWAFGPWAIIGFLTLFQSIKATWKRNKIEYITFWGFAIMFLIFSISKFQLAHYINILFPFLAILVAHFLLENKSKLLQKIITGSFYLYLFLFMLIIGLIEFYYQPISSIWMTVILILGVLGLIMLRVQTKNVFKVKHLLNVLTVALIFGLYCNLRFYPHLLTYQSGTQAALYVNENHPNSEIITTHNSWTLEYVATSKLDRAYSFETLMTKDLDNKLIFVKQAFMDQLTAQNIDYKVIKEFDDFHVTQLNLKFLNKKHRAATLKKHYLIQIFNARF